MAKRTTLTDVNANPVFKGLESRFLSRQERIEWTERAYGHVFRYLDTTRGCGAHAGVDAHTQ